MGTTMRRDARLLPLEWSDLVGLRWWESVKELSLPLPWLAGSLACAASDWWIPALACSFYFYLAGLRLAHDAFHRNLGLPKRGDEIVQLLLSATMLGSMHAVRHNHLHHHTHCLDESDIEGHCAQQSWWRAIVTGPLFPVRNHVNALRMVTGSARRWMFAEYAVNAAVLAGALASTVVAYHVIAMAIGQCLSGFFCVWTVHHDTEHHDFPGRTERGWFRNLVFMGMFFHAEHHLYPRVPTCHLERLAERIDALAPEIREKAVF